MPSGVNRVMILGNVGRDPEMRYTPNGDALLEFSVAVNERKDDDAEWFNCVLFGERAEKLAQYITKGSRVFVEGRQRTDKWTDKDTGQARSRSKIRVMDIQLLGGDGKQRQRDDYNDDLPFE